VCGNPAEHAAWKRHEVNNEAVISVALARHPRDINKMVVDADHGKEAISRVRVCKSWEINSGKAGGSSLLYSLLDVKIETGRYCAAPAL